MPSSCLACRKPATFASTRCTGGRIVPLTGAKTGSSTGAICPRLPLYEGTRRSMLEAVAFALACVRLIGEQFDVVEADHMPYLQLFTLWVVTRLRRRPLVVTWNEVWGPEYWGTYLGRVTGRIAWWVERVAMNLGDEILAVSTGTAERLRAYVGDSVPIRVVHNGVDLERIRGVSPAVPRMRRISCSLGGYFRTRASTCSSTPWP